MKREQRVAGAGVLLFGLGVLLPGVQVIGPRAWAGDRYCSDIFGSCDLNLFPACELSPEYGQLAVRFGDQKVSRIATSEGQEIDVVVVLDLPEGGALLSWSFDVGEVPPPYLGSRNQGLELLEARTHEAALALEPSFEETQRDESRPDVFHSEVRFDFDIIPRLPRGTRTLPLARARYRVLSFATQDCRRSDISPSCPTMIRIWGGSPTLQTVPSSAFVFPGDSRLRTMPDLLSGPYANVPAPAGLAVGLRHAGYDDDYDDSRRLFVGAPGLSRVRSVVCSGSFVEEEGAAFQDPTSLAYDPVRAGLFVAATHPVTLGGVIVGAGFVQDTLERPGAIHIHDSRLYFADIPRRKVFAEAAGGFQLLVDLPTPPHSLAVSGRRLYIGGETDGAVRVYDLETGILEEEPLLTGLGPMVSLAPGPGDEFWGTSLYAVPRAGEYEGKLISFHEGSPPRVLASGFEGRVDLAFTPAVNQTGFQWPQCTIYCSPDFRGSEFLRSVFVLFASEFERDRITFLKARFDPDRVIFAAADEGLVQFFQGASRVVASGVSFSGLAFDAAGTLWGVGTPSGSPDQSLYRIGGVIGGVPRLVEMTSLADGKGSFSAVTGIEWIGGALYAAEEGPGGESFLVTIDPETGQRTPVGESGATGIFEIGGLAFTSLPPTLYALSEADASLYSIAWEPSDGEEPTGTIVGATGLAGVTASGLAFEDSMGILLASGEARSRQRALWALDTWTGEASLPIAIAEGSGGEAVGAIAVSRAARPSKLVRSSSDPTTALAVSGTLSEELSALNAGPPPFDPKAWQPVVQTSIDRGGSFLCAEVADPLELSFLEAREYLLEADEVTFDNCGSAFYRFTFELPTIFESACISGVANVDDQAVVFLNGERISAAMRDPGCEPNSVDPSDPCYALQERGRDSMDLEGRRVLTAPTQDPFGTCDAEKFLPGENELVFAVAGNAGAEDPTGLEFIATVAVDGPAARPELVVTHIFGPPEVSCGETFEVRWEVTNAGFEAAVGPWVDRVYLSRDREIGGDILLGVAIFEAALAPGESVERRAEFTAPRVVGESWLLVITDADGAIDEWTEERNAVFDDRPLTLPAPPPLPGPDLVVTEVTAPVGKKPLLAGTTAEISFTVINAGERPTPSRWEDEVVLVTDRDGCASLPSPLRKGLSIVPSECRESEYRVQNKRVLEPDGDGYTLTVSVSLPEKVAATYFVLVRTDAGAAVPETNEGNNFLFSEPFKTVISDVQPDLVAEDIQFPAVVFSGTDLRVSWIDRNQGSGQTDLNAPAESCWVDSVYLSPNTDPSIVSGDTLLGEFERSGFPLRPGEAERLSLDVHLHPFLEGAFHFKVKTDALNSVSEFGFEGNNVAVSKSPLTVILHPPVDLVPVSLTVEGEISPGYHVTIGWEVENRGADPLPSSSIYAHRDRLRLGLPGRGPIYLNHEAPESPSYSVSGLSVLIPESVPEGPATLRVVVDADERIPEESEANNEVSREVVVESRFADLVLEVLEPPPASVTPGAMVDLRWRVTNSGPSATSDFFWNDEVFIRPLGDEGPGHSLAVFKSPELQEGKTRRLLPDERYERQEPVTFNWPDLLWNLGQYELIVVTDSGSVVREVHRENNRISIPLAVEASRGRSDVLVTGISWRWTSVSPPVLEVQWTEQNVSPFPTVGGWSSFLYWSRDPLLGADYSLTEALAVPGLDPGEEVTHAVSSSLGGALPPWLVPSLPTPSFYLIATSYRLDANIPNNTRTQRVNLREDLLSGMSIAVNVEGDLIAGRSVRVSWTVSGVEHAREFIGEDGESIWEFVFLGDDAFSELFDHDGNLVAHRAVEEAPAAGRVPNDEGWTNSQEFGLPGGVTGSRFIFVWVYPRGVQGGVPLEIAPGSPGDGMPPSNWDLEVSDVLLAPAGVLGEPADVKWRTWNRGPDVGRGAWLDSLYLSEDATWDIGDHFIGRFRSRLESPLEAGASRDFRVTSVLSGVNPGDYHVLVRADVYDQIPESDETNNIAASIGTIAVSARRLELGVPLETTLVDGEELYFEVPGVPAGETLRVTLDHASPVMLTELYARHGEVASAGRFDHRFHAPGEPDQTVTVPATREGSYFLLANGSGLTTTPEAKRVTFLAELLPFGIESARPGRIGDRGRVTLTVEGSRFIEEGEIYLEDPAGSSWRPHHVEFVNTTQLRATFLLDGLPHGELDVVVTGRDGEVARLRGGVTVEATRGPIVEVAPPAPAAVRPGPAAGTLTLAVANRGNVDADCVFLLNTFEASEGREVVSTSASTPFRGGAVLGGFLGTQAMLRTLAPGETGFLTTFLRPGEASSGDITVGNTVASFTVEKFIETQTKIAEALRQRVVANPESILPDDRERLLERAADRDSWLGLWFEGLVAAGAVLAEDLELAGAAGKTAGEVRSRGRVDDSQSFPAFCDALGGRLCEAWLSYGLKLGVDALGAFGSLPEVEQPSCSGGDFVSSSFCSRWRVLRSTDPNEKTGSDGVGDENFVPKSKPIHYRVEFENVASASAPAAVVRITDPIDPALKLSSFRLEQIAFGETVIETPQDSITFQKRLDLTASRGVFVDVVAGVDPTAGEAFWSFRSIDPLTGEVPGDAQTGFLPPNDEEGRGLGWVEYSLRPNPFATSGPIRNEATITFDAIGPVKTKTVVRTLDVDPPESRIDSLTVLDGSTVELRWSGEDAAGGSGLASYSIYVAEDRGPYTTLLEETKAASVAFSFVPGRYYAFYSLATDRAGNVEEPPEEADAFFPTRSFIRGNCNGDGQIDISDVIFHLGWNFLGGKPPVCLAACDANGDGRVSGEVSDAIYVLGFLFLGGPRPPAPFPECGVSPRPGDVGLGCEEAPACP